MEKQDLKELVDYALDNMPSDSMDEKEREEYRKKMYGQVDEGKVTSPGEVMGEFDRLEQAKGLEC